MPRFNIDIDPANASLTGFGSNVTGAAFTLTANDSGDSLAHRVSIRNDAVTNHTGKTILLVGTDADGNALSEAVTGPDNGATVESAGYFLTLASATPSATIGADTFDIGWVDEISTKTYQLNDKSESTALVHLNVTGTLSATVQVSAKQFRDGSYLFANTTTAALVTASTSLAAELEPGATYMRVLLNSYTDTGELQVYVAQAVQS